MLLYLFYHVLQRYFHALNVFRYITVRTALASLTALLLTLVLGPWVIRRLRELQIGQFIREEGPKSHQAKAGTPTMGGVLIVCSTVIPTLLWGDLENVYVWLAVFTMLMFGAIGFIDDYSKVVKRRNLGLTGARKFLLQTSGEHRRWRSRCSRSRQRARIPRSSAFRSSRIFIRTWWFIRC